MASIHVDIVAAEGDIYHGEAAMVFAPAEMGEVGIAPRHTPLLTRIAPGTVRVQGVDGVEQQFFVGGGILEVQPHLVTILADSALRAKDADEAAALAAKQAAEAKLAGASDQTDLARAQAELVEAAARLQFVQRLKNVSHR